MGQEPGWRQAGDYRESFASARSAVGGWSTARTRTVLGDSVRQWSRRCVSRRVVGPPAWRAGRPQRRPTPGIRAWPTKCRGQGVADETGSGNMHHDSAPYVTAILSSGLAADVGLVCLVNQVGAVLPMADQCSQQRRAKLANLTRGLVVLRSAHAGQ